ASIVGTRYLTYVSAGMAGEIRADYVGTDSLMQRLLIWIGVAWRYHAVHIPIWRKLRRQKKQEQHT
ncbi:MAG TPA: hypothetical protein VLE22_08245, partial [Bryobacteraceae bacterium]|nr:hypothetical protein [Bryobacteraceae bacterium]